MVTVGVDTSSLYKWTFAPVNWLGPIVGSQLLLFCIHQMNRVTIAVPCQQGANYKKILRLSYDVIITYDNRKSNLR